MIPPASISAPCRTLAFSDPALEAAGLTLDPTLEQDFGNLLDQHELGQSDPLPWDASGPNPDASRQAALSEWAWPMIRWNIAPPADAPAPGLTSGEVDIVSPDLPSDFSQPNGPVPSDSAVQIEPQSNPVLPALPLLPVTAAFLTGTSPSATIAPTVSPCTAEPGIRLRPALPEAQAPTSARHTGHQADRFFPVLPSLSIPSKTVGALPEPLPTATNPPAISPLLAEIGTPLRPLLPQAQPLAADGQTEPHADRGFAVLPSFPIPATTVSVLPEPLPDATNLPPNSPLLAEIGTPLHPLLPQAQPRDPTGQTGSSPNRSPAAIPELPSAKSIDTGAGQESAPVGRISKGEREAGTTHQAENVSLAPQGLKSATSPETAAIGSGNAKGPPATSFRPPQAEPAAVPKFDGPAGSPLTSLPPNGLRDSKETGSATVQTSARSLELERTTGDTSKPAAASQRGAESSSIITVPPAAAALAAPAARSPEIAAPGRSDLAPLFEKVWAAAETLSSAHPGRMDLDVPLRDNETVRIRVELRSGEIHATIRTDSPELREALEKSWPDFATKTVERGFKLADANFSSLRQDAGGSPGGQGRDHRPEQNSWQHRPGGQASQSGGHAQPGAPSAAPPNRVPATAGPMTLWA